ncbi:tRNA lysidine(34) synthetase TilS [Mycolicibacillus parakoreensis]|uniref:tRNA(Ile)-lysidine synthase n=1 Tax=Mycolicibacillus parakoreensis TaxID=1069221 RepID=A0ABY3TZI7_9MYCO|nr:tRNA lysidine(34) synthetase TilS [Mycolicibacillus parakoreensis]MCV7314546.1 tRNA lysidine(34) synthetase TilS [Mycolicibacillus parakoreensis]ULN53123.1 tRNA lysidine(34) synthetase TilS [Mycolicibacillus parakoreensis]HLS00116.1 tRNA lysidine(34) synthetase TilS [Mycolicibacillus parakoreensis]
MDRSGALAAPLATLRTTVRRFAAAWLAPAEHWCVALSGGPDSLALTAVAARLRPTTALIVDHRLQPGSAQVAATARAQALALGCVDARVLTVTVGTGGGPEAAARRARYTALQTARDGAPVLLGHTLDDQAETVLLGLGRGSGPRSLAGMRPCDPPWHRPLLAVRRALTHAACAELGVAPWSDPHNTDRRFTRARLRAEVLPLLEEVLGGGVAEALARTATALREDTAVLDALAEAARPAADVDGGALAVAALAALAGPVRRRVIRRWLLDGGAGGPSDHQIRRIDALVTDWRGQGGVAIGSALTRRRLVAARRDALLVLRSEPVGR